MTKSDILQLIKNDPWMMNVIGIAKDLNLPEWVIGAGFVRNKVWNHLHGYTNKEVDTHDIDLVYYDPSGNDEKADQELSLRLTKETGINFEVVNQFYAHKWNGVPPYTSTEDAISTWPETATAVGVTIKDNRLWLIAPHSVDDLVNIIVRSSPRFKGNLEAFKRRVKEKCWAEKYPKIRFEGMKNKQNKKRNECAKV